MSDPIKKQKTGDSLLGRFMGLVLTGLFALIVTFHNFFGKIWEPGDSHAPDRRDALQKSAGGVIALGMMALPFGLARFLAPAGGKSFDLKSSDKAKRNLLNRQNRNHRMPPGALADSVAFQKSCIGCGLCGEICPPRCIKFHTRDGGFKANTPYIDASERACTLCGKCMEVCPTDALTITQRQKVDMGVAQIDRSACFPWVDRGICGACVGICPIGPKAISFKSFNQYRPMVHEACVGCGLCVEVCPHPSTPIWIVDRALGTVAPRGI